MSDEDKTCNEYPNRINAIYQHQSDKYSEKEAAIETAFLDHGVCMTKAACSA